MTTYVAVDYGAIAHNLRQARSGLKAGCRLMAVVKANAYGHGLVPTARACVEAGADMLGVADIQEGVQLREAGVDAPTLIFLPLLRDEAALAVSHGLIATVTDSGQLTALRRAADLAARTARFHIFFDSGLGRAGADEQTEELIRTSAQWPQVRLEGVYTHFDSSQPGSSRIGLLDVLRPGAETAVLASMLKTVAREHLKRDILFHAAASAGFLEAPQNHLDMVRIGTLLYGQWPPHTRSRTLELRETFELRTRVIAVHTLPPRSRVGYGAEFICRRKTRVGTLPVGYAHGLGVAPVSLTSSFRRWLTQHARGGLEVRVAGGTAPIIGRISMDQCAIDLTDLPSADVGCEVVLPVRRLCVSAQIPRIATNLGGP